MIFRPGQYIDDTDSDIFASDEDIAEFQRLLEHYKTQPEFQPGQMNRIEDRTSETQKYARKHEYFMKTAASALETLLRTSQTRDAFSDM